MIEAAIIAIALMTVVAIWIVGVLSIVLLSREGYASIKEDIERKRLERIGR